MRALIAAAYITFSSAYSNLEPRDLHGPIHDLSGLLHVGELSRRFYRLQSRDDAVCIYSLSKLSARAA